MLVDGDSMLPAQSTLPPSVASKPVSGPLPASGQLPPVARDNSISHVGNNPGADLILASELQSGNTGLSSETDSAIAKLSSVLNGARSPDYEERISSALALLKAAIKRELYANIGPNAGEHDVSRAVSVLIDRVKLNSDGGVIVCSDRVRSEIFDQVEIEIMNDIDKKNLATVFAKYPNVLMRENMVRWARNELDAANPVIVGRAVSSAKRAVLRQALVESRDAWAAAGEQASRNGNTVLREACERAFLSANDSLEKVDDPISVEIRENPAYVRGLDAEVRLVVTADDLGIAMNTLDPAKIAEARAGFETAKDDYLHALKAAVEDAVAGKRDPAYTELCRTSLKLAATQIEWMTAKYDFRL